MADRNPVIASPISQSKSFKKFNRIHKYIDFDSYAASFSSSVFGVAPTTPFSSLADPDASSVADLLKSIPGVTHTSRGGFFLPDSASMLGELCGDFLNGECTNEFCSLTHPPNLLLAGAVCSLMTRYCQPKAEPQPSSDLAGNLKPSYCETCDLQEGDPNSALVSISAMAAYCDKSHEELRLEDYQLGNKGGGKGTLTCREKNKKLHALFENNKKAVRLRKLITTDEAFMSYCSNSDRMQQLCDGPVRGAYLYYEASEIYRREPSLQPFHEVAEYVVNKYNSEQKENLEVKKVLKANWLVKYFYMTIEAWDNKANRDRTLQAVVWVKGSRDFVVGFVKDVTDSCVSS